MLDPKHSRPAHLQLIAIAWNFGWPVVAGVVVGYWIDEKVGSSPVVTLTLGLGAMVTAVWRLIDLGRKESIERHEHEHELEMGRQADNERERHGENDEKSSRFDAGEDWPREDGS